jgi:hypothetical protein
VRRGVLGANVGEEASGQATVQRVPVSYTQFVVG